MAIFYAFLAILIGYLLGSISWACIIGRFIGKFDLRTTEPDGRISASAIRRRLGFGPFLIVGFLDILKGFLAILIAKALTDSQTTLLLVGIFTVIGHNWSILLNFKGGLGSTVVFGVLAGLVLWEFLIGLVIGLLALLVTKKPTLSTIFFIISVLIALLISGMPIYLVVYPIVLSMVLIAKYIQKSRLART
jgi:glycerol-3-phosphate acyltransferase PlsY